MLSSCLGLWLLREINGMFNQYGTLSFFLCIILSRKFASFSASSELSTDAEDMAMFWVNKTCASFCHHLRELNPSVCPESLTMDDIKDVNDGRCLAAVISFYCPQELPPSGQSQIFICFNFEHALWEYCRL